MLKHNIFGKIAYVISKVTLQVHLQTVPSLFLLYQHVAVEAAGDTARDALSEFESRSRRNRERDVTGQPARAYGCHL